MSVILAQRLKSLQLDGQPGILPKAHQFYDMITQRVRTSRNSSFTLCRETIAIQLACEKLSIEFNQVAASTISSVALPTYQASVQEARVALGLTHSITLEELDVQFGPPDGVIRYARQLLDEFKDTLGATMPAAARRSMDWSGSVYIVAAFVVVCKYMKKRAVAKAKLLSLAGIKPAVLASVQSKMEEHGKKTIADITSGGGSMAKAAARAPTRKHARDTVPPAELAVSTRPKRTRTQPPPAVPDIAQPAVQTRGKGTTTVPSAAVVSPQPTRKQPARSSRGSGDTPAKAPVTPVVPAKAATRKRVSKKPPKQPRIGIVSMIQDRDYKSTALYADYQHWKHNILSH